MEDLLQRLEVKLKELVFQHHQLKQSNNELAQDKILLNREKAALMDVQQKAIHQIENLVCQLKEFESHEQNNS